MESDEIMIGDDHSLKRQYGRPTAPSDSSGGFQASVRKPAGVRALVVVQLIMAVIAIPSGVILLADPSGSIIGGGFLLPHLKEAIPFLNDFTAIGAWLLVVFGILPAVLALNLTRGRKWAWLATVVLGGIELSWIAAELLMFYDLGFTPMYPLIGGIGAATLMIALLPSLRKYSSES